MQSPVKCLLLLAHFNPNTLTILLGIRYESIGHHLAITPICLKQFPPAILSVILLAAKPAPNHRKQQEHFAIRQLHAQTLPGSVGERHYVALELRVLDKTLGAELHGIFKDVWVEMDKWCGYADWYLGHWLSMCVYVVPVRMG